MSYYIMLPRRVEVDIFDLPKDFDDVVKRTFAEYTNGTSKEYRYVDKLGYIDCFISHLNNAFDPWEEVDNLVKEYSALRWDESRELISEDDIYCVDFMVDCYEKGRDNSRLKSYFGTDDHHIYDEIGKVLIRVITVIMNCSDRELEAYWK